MNSPKSGHLRTEQRRIPNILSSRYKTPEKGYYLNTLPINLTSLSRIDV